MAVGTALAVGGCGDPKAASKANFQKALSAFFDKDCAMLSPARSALLLASAPPTFPVNINLGPMRDADAPRYEALADAGLLKTGPETRSVNMFGQATTAVSFNFTDKGRSLWKAPNALGPGSPGGFCAGTIHVVSVSGFTAPVDEAGQRVSQVTFTMQATYDDWTTAPAVQSAFREETSRTGPNQMALPLVLMNDGWKVATGLSGLPGGQE